MKKRLLISISTLFFFGIIFSGIAGAWQATLTATGEAVDGIDLYEVIFGVEATSSYAPSPPPPPGVYSVIMDLYSLDWATKGSTIIFQQGQDHYTFNFSINPRGNLTPSFQTRNSTLSWIPSQLGPGTFQLKDMDGNILVEDMKLTNSYLITGKSETPFIIDYVPATGNQSPVSSNGSLTVNAYAATTSSLSAQDADSDSLTFTFVTLPTKGTVEFIDQQTGQYTYTPHSNQTGVDSFTFLANDGTVDSNISTVAVTISIANSKPVISEIGPQNTQQNTPISSIEFTVSDSETPASDLIVTASSANQSLVPDGNIVLGGSGENRSITINPATDVNGAVIITISVSDGENSVSKSFTLSIGDFSVMIEAPDSLVPGDDISVAFWGQGIDVSALEIKTYIVFSDVKYLEGSDSSKKMLSVKNAVYEQFLDETNRSEWPLNKDDDAKNGTFSAAMTNLKGAEPSTGKEKILTVTYQSYENVIGHATVKCEIQFADTEGNILPLADSLFTYSKQITVQTNTQDPDSDSSAEGNLENPDGKETEYVYIVSENGILNIELKADGSFSLPSLAAGSYSIVVKYKDSEVIGQASFVSDGVSSAATINFSDLVFVPDAVIFDIDGREGIDFFDYIYIAKRYGTSLQQQNSQDSEFNAEESYDEKADLNNDSKINFADLGKIGQYITLQQMLVATP